MSVVQLVVLISLVGCVVAHTFSGQNSFALYEGLTSDDYQLLVKFKTFQPDGTLLYLQDTEGKYISLKLSQGRLKYVGSLGGEVQKGFVGRNLNDMSWHRVIIKPLGNGLGVTLFLSKRVHVKPVLIQGKFSRDSVFVGGIPYNFKPSSLSVAHDSSLLGCIVVKFLRAGRHVPRAIVQSNGTLEGCLNACKTEPENACLNSGRCVNRFTTSVCDCKNTGFTGEKCEEGPLLNDAWIQSEKVYSTTQSTTTDQEESSTTTEEFTTNSFPTDGFSTNEPATSEEYETTAPPTQSGSQKPGPQPQCGRKGRRSDDQTSVKQKIVRGTVAEPGEYPWQVALLDKMNRQFCGGSLIDPQWVLTAAHCLKGSPAKVRVGEHNLQESSQYERNIRIATRGVIKHAAYVDSDEDVDYDIALLKLARKVQINKRVGTVCLNTDRSPYKPNKKCVISGWGKLGELQSGSAELREAVVPLVSTSKCKQAYGQAITPRMICAGGNGRDTCQGDSGGPLVCEDKGIWYLTGITSWGEGCGNVNKFGVYTNVAYFIDWIKKKMKNN